MKRTLMTMAFLLGALLALAPASLRAAAQAPDPRLHGVTNEVLSSGMPADANGRVLLLMRMTLAPGTSIPPHHHPGPVALTVVSGLFGTQFSEGTGRVTLAASSGGTPPPVVQMQPGDNLTLHPGDALFYDGATHTMRNDGDTNVVLLVSALFDPNQPGFIFATPATPAAAASDDTRS